MDTIYSYLKHLVLFLVGGILYIAIELLWRGYSHWSMVIVGGIAFMLIGLINEYLRWDMPLWKQCGIAAIIITILELITGIIVNLWLGWDVWHYERYDILGQISLPMMIAWYWLSLVGIVLDDVLRWLIFSEEKPHYKLN